MFSFLALYIGLTIGLCGSLTSFSAIMVNAATALYSPVEGPFPVSRYFVVLISAFASSFVGFILGRHLAVVTFPSRFVDNANISSNNERTRELRYEKNASIGSFRRFDVKLWLFPSLFVLTIPLLVLLTVLLPVGLNTFILFSLIFAPFGALTRWLLSFLNEHFKVFPLGTFLANVIGSFLLLGMLPLSLLVPISSDPTNIVGHLIVGVIQGYCGCLSTVSTFALEVNTMKRRYAYVYFILSVGVVQAVFLAVGGGLPFLFR